MRILVNRSEGAAEESVYGEDQSVSEDQRVMQLLHQNSLQHGTDLHSSSMVNQADLRHYQTHQQRQPLE